MNRSQKLFVFLLVTAALCLTAAVVSFRLSAPAENPADAGKQPEPGSTAVTLFVGPNGLWGARAANGRILIEPAWPYLRTMSDTVLIARRNDGRADHFGLIRTNGEQLVPFLYTSFALADSAEPDLWMARFTENDTQYVHLYHADGSRWSDTAWETCTYEDGILSVSAGNAQRQGVLHAGSIQWQSLYAEYPVGLHRLVMEQNDIRNAQLPPVSVLSQLGEAAAGFLRYLFVTKTVPEAFPVSTENPAAIRVDYRYPSCRLVSAEVSRVKIRGTDGLPSYLVQMQVVYQRTEDDGSQERIETAMELVITRNAAGAYTYSSFSDSQMNAASGGRMN